MSLLLALASPLLSPAWALTVQVNPGDDLAAVTSSLAAGDEIVFNDGTYTLTSTLSLTGQGTADSPIVLRAADGASPVLQLDKSKEGGWASSILYLNKAAHFQIEGLSLRGGEGWDQEDAGFSGLAIYTSSDIVVSELEVARTGRNSVVLGGDNSRLTLLRPHLHDTRDGDGITAGCGDASCWLADSTIDQAWIHGIRGSRHGIYLAHGSQGNRIVDSVLYDLEYRGIYLGSTEFGEPNSLERSAIWQTGDWAVTVYGAARVRNNLVFESEGGGIYTGDPDREAYEDVVVSYNTVVDTADYAFHADDWTLATGVVLSSNAFCNPVGLGVDVEREVLDTGTTDFSDARISHNVVCGYVEGLSEDDDHLQAGAGWADFLDVEGWNLYPTSSAVLLDSGDPAGAAWPPETDFNGVARPGDAPDVGAYEWTQADNPGWVVQQGYKSLDVQAGPAPEVMGGCCKKKDDQAADTGAALLLPLGLLAGLRRLRRREDHHR